MKKVAKKMYETFPSSVYTISSYGVTFLLENKNKEALELYKKAEKINPNDVIVLNNIAIIYERLADIEQAKKYYKKIVSVGDEKSKTLAQKKLAELK
ncbi:tetratricopeptide repeat protein [Flavobacterium ardleyense]|uniref:Tetratricopeptide repeat protein n=1 Tax=Flavobacterium ardleyense TaxID=2038737 RepID=A0ABW5Z605_9FLAO